MLKIEFAFDIMQLDIIRISKDRKSLLNQGKSSLDGTDNFKPLKGTAVSDIDRFRLMVCSRSIWGCKCFGA